MNIIYYFTGTGNSLRVAKEMASKLGECKIENIAKAEKITEDYEKIGVVFPVYCAGVPNMVRGFLENTNFSSCKNPYFFAVSTYGGSAGSSIEQVNSILTKRGLKLNYGNSIKMFANYVVLYPMKTQQAEEDSVQTGIDEIIKDVIVKKDIEIKNINPVLNTVLKTVMKSFSGKSKGYVVSDECNSCGVCEKVCPSNNIKMENGKPSFGKSCEQCVACIQWCAKEAINYKKATVNRGRYTHPSIKVNEVFVK